MRRIICLGLSVFINLARLNFSLRLNSRQTDEYPSYNNGANTTYHSVEQGDTLSYLARRYNTTLEAIAYSNYFVLNPYLLYPGEVLYIPTSSN
jgi:LysM repeat protein